MAPFLRVTAVKCIPSNGSLNGDSSEYYVAVNVKECVMENGRLF